MSGRLLTVLGSLLAERRATAEYRTVICASLEQGTIGSYEGMIRDLAALIARRSGRELSSVGRNLDAAEAECLTDPKRYVKRLALACREIEVSGRWLP